MKKKLLSICFVLTMILTVTACGKKDSSSTESTTSVTEVTAEGYAAQITKDGETYAQYVTLGNYKGIAVEVDRSTLEVSDSAISDYIDTILTSHAETTNATTGVTKVGDAITLDYSGLLDGQAFSNGTATDATYTVGSGKFIEDLDKGLVGLEVGKEYDIPCKFPDTYSSATLAGKDVIFRVTVTAISENVLPEYNDEFVQSIAADYDASLTTTTEFTAYVKNYLKETAQNTFDSAKYQLIIDEIKKNTTISGYPQTEVDGLVDTIVENVKSEYSTYGSYYGITDFNAYISSVYGFESEDAMKEAAVTQAQSYLDEKMMLTLIATKENFTVTADEINALGAELASYYGYTDYQEILDSYGNEMNAEVGYSALSDKVIAFLVENSIEK